MSLDDKMNEAAAAIAMMDNISILVHLDCAACRREGSISFDMVLCCEENASVYLKLR